MKQQQKTIKRLREEGEREKQEQAEKDRIRDKKAKDDSCAIL